MMLMQAQLLDSLFGTERGLSASSEVRAEINELITQLEAKSPNSDMSEVCPRLDVRSAAPRSCWRLRTPSCRQRLNTHIFIVSQACRYLIEGQYT